MEYFTVIAAVIVIHLFVWLTPGPLFVLIIRNSLLYSRGLGFWTATGIALGNTIHVTIAITGVGALISASDTLALLVKILAAGYLVYLGLKTMLSTAELNKAEISENNKKDITAFQALRTGFLVNILSPKAPLFFGSLLGSVLALNPPMWVIVFLWVALPLNSLFMASLLSVFFTQKKVRAIYARYQKLINKILGVLLLVFAFLVLLV